jgi:hypothetical protein
MGATAEVRWFFRGRAPARLASWFADVGAEPQERTDHYLRLPETDTLGIKLRGGGGALEIKLREREYGPQQLLGTIAGRVEQWRKWAADVGAGEPPPDQLVVVHKSRRMVTFTPPDWRPLLQPPDPSGDGGCNAEITSLRAEGDDGEWSTLGMEAFGPEPAILGSLHRACQAFFGAVGLAEGPGADLSCGYPGWLRHLAQNRGA